MPRHVDLVAVCEDVSLDEVAYIVSVAIVSSLNSFRVLLRGNIALCEVARDAACLRVVAFMIAKANLNCFVAVVFNSLLLSDNTRAGFNDGYGNDLPFSSKICVMPIFLPMIAFCILYTSCSGYWLDSLPT